MKAIGVLLCLVVATASAFSLHPVVEAHKRHRVEHYLRDIAGSDSAALFGVLTPQHKFHFYTGGPISKHNYLRYGSISKIFTSDLWFDQYRDDIGEALSLRSNALGFSKYTYPDSDKVSYRQILSMTSGIHEYTLNIGYNETAGQFIPPTYSVPENIDLGWKNTSLDFVPGDYFLYSNTNCEVVGLSAQRAANKSIYELLAKKWKYVAPTLKYDDGTLPDTVWPNTEAYIPWFYPAALPGVSGSLVGKPADLLKAFRAVADDKKTLRYRREWTDAPKIDLPAYIPAGNKYGLFWQKYDDLHGSAEGHEGDLVVRSIVVRHKPSGNDFLFHYAMPMDNATILIHLKKLIAMFVF
jgi:hypothetical protein